MSSPGNSGNNKHLPPFSPPVIENRFSRHPDYYYEDGSTVFQAGDCLFKFQASLLKADPGVGGYKFEEIMKRRLGGFSIFNHDPGSSDSTPIILPIDADSFGLLLYVLLGREGDPVISSLLATTPGEALDNPETLIAYLTAGAVASYFGMRSIQSWARSRVRLILESADSVAAQEWPGDYLVRLSDYLKTTDLPELQHELLGFMQLMLSFAVAMPSTLPTEDRNVKFLICVDLYQTRTLVTSNPILFGFVFVVLLSLGHRSPFWTEHLTRDDRMVLYAAHADLTRLSDHKDLRLDWLGVSIASKDACAASCYQNLARGWKKTFGQCKPLDSAIPLEDINQILTFPKHRFAFARETSNQQSQLRCVCAQKFLDKIDGEMSKLFCGFTRKHEALAGNT